MYRQGSVQALVVGRRQLVHDRLDGGQLSLGGLGAGQILPANRLEPFFPLALLGRAGLQGREVVVALDRALVSGGLRSGVGPSIQG